MACRPCTPKFKPSGRRLFVLPPPNPGLRRDGNINIFERPSVPAPEGGCASVRSISIGDSRGEILIPSVVGKRVVSDMLAIRHFKSTGEHLGIFDSVKHANWYAERLHEQQARIQCLH